jgi:hypothetical protein
VGGLLLFDRQLKSADSVELEHLIEGGREVYGKGSEDIVSFPMLTSMAEGTHD